MKETPLCSIHKGLGAKMAEFAGYNMPIEYVGINEEHHNVRTKVGVFDVSHMGDIWVKGPRAIEFLQKVTSNDISSLVDGQVQYNCFPNPNGGIKDDFLTYRMDAETFLLVVNAANIEKDWNWLLEQGREFGLTEGKELYNASEEICQLAVQGPKAMEVVQKLCDEPVTELKYYTFKQLKMKGLKQDAILSITGYTGAGGCEIYCHTSDLVSLWSTLLEEGKPEGIIPIGLGARDTLRLEMGFCLYGHDIDENTCPIEAGLGWITKLVDGKKGMIGRDIIEKMKMEKPSRHLIGFEMVDKGIPRQHYVINDGKGNKIGEVTSGTMSPMMKIGIGMGYVTTGFHKPDTHIYVEVRGKQLKAKVVKLPIYRA